MTERAGEVHSPAYLVTHDEKELPRSALPISW